VLVEAAFKPIVELHRSARKGFPLPWLDGWMGASHKHARPHEEQQGGTEHPPTQPDEACDAVFHCALITRSPRRYDAPMQSDEYLVLDIETAPDRDVYTPPEPQPGVERPFPPLYACKVLVIGVMWLDQNLAVKRHGTIAEGKDEGALLQDFSEFMAKHKPHLITWNGRGFDLPVLALRALRHGVPMPWYYQDSNIRFRFKAEGHLDLCDFLSDFGAAMRTSLAGAAKLVGLPGKDGVDGSQVEGLYNAGQMDALREYCLSDVAQTAFLFMRYRVLTGALSVERYREAASAMLDHLRADRRFERLVKQINTDQLLLNRT